MKKYIAIRDCYFDRLYKEGDIAEFEDDVEVPEHFAPYKTELEKLAEKMVAEKMREVEMKTEPAQNATVKSNNHLEDMTVAELKEMAEKCGIELERNAKKEDIIAAIRGE